MNRHLTGWKRGEVSLIASSSAKPKSQLLGNMGLKNPCKDCPFRSDVCRYLAPARYKEIASSLIDRGESFTCHKTNDFSGDEVRVTDHSCACAGAMIWMQHQGKPNTLMQVMERLGAFDPSRLNMNAPVYRTRQEFEEGV